MKRRDFEKLVVQALEGLPPEFQERLDNVDVVVETEPSPAQRAESGLAPDETLYGLYQGVPLTGRTHDYGLVAPDKITIFQKPIEDDCATPEEMVREITLTVQHEIAHFFGLDDDTLEEIEARKYEEWES
jgi:predicted Zn-dependent protease with MMP-like domain